MTKQEMNEMLKKANVKRKAKKAMHPKLKEDMDIMAMLNSFTRDYDNRDAT